MFIPKSKDPLSKLKKKQTNENKAKNKQQQDKLILPDGGNYAYTELLVS